MQPRSRYIQLTIPIPAKDHRIYVSATRLLLRILGRKAPTVATLILHDLRGRDATGIADDYLDSIGWPRASGRVVLLRRNQLSPLRRSPRRLRGLGQPVDPSRN